jgi:hypothetical protein
MHYSGTRLEGQRKFARNLTMIASSLIETRNRIVRGSHQAALLHSPDRSCNCITRTAADDRRKTGNTGTVLKWIFHDSLACFIWSLYNHFIRKWTTLTAESFRRFRQSLLLPSSGRFESPYQFLAVEAERGDWRDWPGRERGCFPVSTFRAL